MSGFVRIDVIHDRTAHKRNRHPQGSWGIGVRDHLSFGPGFHQMGHPGRCRSLADRILRHERLAAKLQNPRLLNISFHTLRHWKATLEYHKTKDPYYVKQFLGHKSIQSTELYINIEHTLFDSGSDNFIVKATQDPKEVKALLEVGFEYVCQKDNLIFLRKPK